MDKRSFSFLFILVAASMVALGTYKAVKKKNQTSNMPVQLIGKISK